MNSVRYLTAQILLGVLALNALPALAPLALASGTSGEGARSSGRPHAKKPGLTHRELKLHFSSGGKNVITFGITVGEKPDQETKPRKNTVPPVLAPESPTELPPATNEPVAKTSRLKPFLINGLIATLVWFGAEVKKHPIEISQSESHFVVKMPGLKLDLDGEGPGDGQKPETPRVASREIAPLIPHGVVPDLRVPPRIPKAKVPGSQFESDPVGGGSAAPVEIVGTLPQFGAAPPLPTAKDTKAEDARQVAPAIRFLIDNARRPGLSIEVASTRGPITITDPVEVRKHLVKEVKWLKAKLLEHDLSVPMSDADVLALNNAITDLGFKADTSSGFLQLSDTAAQP